MKDIEKTLNKLKPIKRKRFLMTLSKIKPQKQLKVDRKYL